MAEKSDASAEKTFPLSYIVSALVIGIIVGVLLSVFWHKTPSNKQAAIIPSKDANQVAGGTVSPVSSDSGASSSVENKNDSLSVSDQAAGLYVAIAHANVGEGDWVVIQEDHLGQPGNTLGAARFVDGATSGTVELLRGTMPGQKYHAVVYKDNGDHIFSLDGDVPLRDESGNPIQVTFKTN